MKTLHVIEKNSYRKTSKTKAMGLIIKGYEQRGWNVIKSKPCGITGTKPTNIIYDEWYKNHDENGEIL